MNKNTQELLNAGSDILKRVTIAVDTNDYSRLVSDIGKVVRSVKVERKPVSPGNYRQNVRVTYENGQHQPEDHNYFLQKKVSTALGVPTMVGTGLGAGAMASTASISLILGSMTGVVISSILLISCIVFFIRGCRKNALALKYYRYGEHLNNMEFFRIGDLARELMKSDREVLRDLKRMIGNGFLPRARFDRAETTCMITDKSYQMYLDALKGQQQREITEQARAEQAKTENRGLPDDVRSIIAEGNEYVAFVHRINDVIPDTEEMSTKLYRLEEIMNRIFDQVRKEPRSADELYKLMNYYLPTTKKLLTAYVELDKQPVAGDNITKTKLEIDSAMDTINEAFENLLNSLFQDMAWDISSDISVMKTMMAQDGLTDSELQKV